MEEAESIWLRPERAARGPAPEHSRAEIASAAVALADAGGLAAASMRKVAEAVGTGPASLYRYVRNRDELLVLMADRVAGEVPRPEPSGDWVADLTVVAHGLRDAYLRHPWVLDAMPAATDLGPNTVDHMDNALAILAGLDVPAGRKLEAIAMLNGVTTLFARQTLAGGDGLTPERQAATAAYLTSVVVAGRHPHLSAALVASGGAAGQSADGLFDRVVGGVLTGLLGQAG